MTDISRLNAAERDVLTLLARGHTAKSIATLTGRTEGSVNERLREARRKTGVGSSRELARLLARENRDEQSGVADATAPAPVPVGASLVARRQGLIIMALFIGGLVAAMALLAPGQQDDPLFAAVAADSGRALDRWRAALTSEPREPVWADTTERKLRQRYSAIHGVDPGALRITCRRSICEVLGRSADGTPSATLQRAARALEAPALRDALMSDGLHADVTGTHSGDQDEPYHFAFVAYWIKQGQKPPV